MSILDDVRVLDLTHAMAGPMCTMFLGCMGAEIIKIEPPWGELSRFNPPLVKGGTSPYFAYSGRQKKGLTINLKTEKGLKIFKDLVEMGDVVVENFGPGAMDRLGLSYEVLKEINPQIIYASISGFGQYGPWSKGLSFNPIAQAASGYMELVREHMDLESPKVAPESIADTIPALFCMVGILSALYHRKKTGRGQRIDVAQLDSMIAVYPSIVYYAMAGVLFGRSVQLRTRVGGTIKCRDGYIQCSVPRTGIQDRFNDTLRKETGKEEIDKKAFEEWALNKTVEEAFQILFNARVPVAPVLTLPEAIQNPQVLAREMIIELEHPAAGKYKSPGFPIKFSETRGKFDMPSPLLGQHNEEILVKLLGHSEEEIAKLKEEEVI